LLVKTPHVIRWRRPPRTDCSASRIDVERADARRNEPQVRRDNPGRVGARNGFVYECARFQRRFGWLWNARGAKAP
jgi:hypothetical protein